MKQVRATVFNTIWNKVYLNIPGYTDINIDHELRGFIIVSICVPVMNQVFEEVGLKIRLDFLR